MKHQSELQITCKPQLLHSSRFSNTARFGIPYGGPVLATSFVKNNFAKTASFLPNINLINYLQISDFNRRTGRQNTAMPQQRR